MPIKTITIACVIGTEMLTKEAAKYAKIPAAHADDIPFLPERNTRAQHENTQIKRAQHPSKPAVTKYCKNSLCGESKNTPVDRIMSSYLVDRIRLPNVSRPVPKHF